MSAALVCLLCERCGFRSIPLGTPDALCNPCRGHARPLDYAGRCERYAARRGWAYDEHEMSIHHLTPAQRRRAIRKEKREQARVYGHWAKPEPDDWDGGSYDHSPADEYFIWPRDDSPSYRDSFAY